MSIAQRSIQSTRSGTDPKDRILDCAQSLFAHRGYSGTTTRDLAQAVGIAEGTLFRHFENKKAILVAVVTRGWVELLTDLLTALSEMSSSKAVAQVLRNRMLHFHQNADMLRVCFMEAQFHPELSGKIQTDIIDKMTDVAEAFFQTAMERGEYRPMNPKIVARVFLGMFTVAGFSQGSILTDSPSVSEMKDMAEGMADIFLNGVLANPEPKR